MNHNQLLKFKAPTVLIEEWIYPAITGYWLVLVALVLTCFAFATTTQAQLPSPTPDGGYPNGNTAEGDGALASVTIGSNNTAIGFDALGLNTTGSDNTATGLEALLSNTDGALNTATGFQALQANTDGNGNTATGADALLDNTTGSDNTATGGGALLNNNTGTDNTATGNSALESNSTGSQNAGYGRGALGQTTSGSHNTAAGYQALVRNKTGVNNVGLGFDAGFNLTTGSNNIEIGANVLGVAGEANTIRIGKQGTQKSTFVAGIFGTPITGSTVVVNSSGRLGVATSSARFKDQIKPMDKASEAILALQPVTFRYKHELDPDGVPQFGLVAEQVEKVNPDLVARDEDGKVTTVRYEAVNAMLLNAFLKEHQRAVEEHRKVEEQGASIAQLKKQVEALTATVQRVSDQVALSKPSPQLVANP